jgi:hypothetical protein
LADLPFRARAFGQNWASDLPLGRFDCLNAGVSATDFTVQRVAELADREILACRGRNAIHADGFRFSWIDIATFDVHFERDIRYLTLDGWRGILPDAFYSTVAAMAVAGVGLLPMHASAIELDGRAFLFAGSAGAGKSTLTAELLTFGARFLGDDLTVITPPDGKQSFRVTRGRPTMRLHAETANLVDKQMFELVPDDPRGKLLVQPSKRATDSEFPLAGIFIIGPGPAEVPLSEVLQLLPAQMFRPHWMNSLPGRGQRRAWLIEMAGKIPVRRLPAVAGFDADARRRRVQTALTAIAGLGTK